MQLYEEHSAQPAELQAFFDSLTCVQTRGGARFDKKRSVSRHKMPFALEKPKALLFIARLETLLRGTVCIIFAGLDTLLDRGSGFRFH